MASAPTPPPGDPTGFDTLDRLSVGVVRIGADGRVTEVNRSALKLKELDRDQVVGQPFATCPLWSQASTISNEVAQAVAAAAAGQTQTFDVEEPDALGLPNQFRVTLRPLRHGRQPPYEVVGEAINITAHHLIEQALRESQREIAKAQQMARVGSWSWVIDGDFVTWSAELYRIFGIDPRRWPPNWSEHDRLYVPESFERLRAAVETCISSGAPFLLELEFVHASGRRGWLLSQGEADMDLKGRVLRLRGTAQDITEQRRLHDIARRELAQARALAAAHEERSRLEGEIVQFLAHEIRQPLNNASAALQSAAKALARNGQGLPPLAHAETVLAQVIGALNNSLAAASLLVAGDTQAFSDTDVDTLTALVLHDIDLTQRARVRVERQAGAHTVQVQANLMRLALSNLLNNALAYAPAATPVVLRVADSDDPLAVLFDVVDQGPGFPEDLLARVFDKGVRGSNAYTRHGAGLGLYIVQRVASLHGGAVAVMPRGPGQPNVVRLTIPQGLVR